ncbi:MAG: hypothetical protein WCE80_13995 [Acidimicrobiia bacterium]
MPTDPAKWAAGMTTVEGGEPVIDWAALAPHIAHPVREGIVEAVRRIGEPLSKSDLLPILRSDDPELSLSQVSYFATTLVGTGVLVTVAERATAGSMETLYFFPGP